MKFKLAIALVVVAAFVITVFAITRGERGLVEIRLGPAITDPQVHISDFGDAIVLAPDGTVWGWGVNSGALLGTGLESERPYRLDVGSNWVAVAPAHTHAVGIKRDGTLWAWSFNPNLQRLTGAPIMAAHVKSPTQVAAGSNWAAVAAGFGGHALTLRSDGALFAWGRNTHGQVGDGTTNAASQPVMIGTNRNWSSIAACSFGSAGIQSDGMLYQWGLVRSGFTDQPQEQFTQPARVDPNSTWQSVHGSDFIFAAQRSDHSIWVWGPNSKAHFGATNVMTPHRLALESQFDLVGAMREGVLLRNAEGELWAVTQEKWEAAMQPFLVGGPRTYTQAWCGPSDVCVALAKDGTLWTWGTRLGIQTERPWADTINQLAAKLGLRSISITARKAPPVETEPWPIARFVTNQAHDTELQQP
jgi:alpha-tubulin suppressor-like RCC1 family protein